MDTTASTDTAPGYSSNRDNMLKRLRRIGGQVEGIERMVENERYCIDVLTQIAAAQAALDRVALGLLDDHARHCLVGSSGDDLEDRTTEMMDAVGRLIRSR